MKPIKPIKSILHNCWALLGHYKSKDALSAIKFHVKSAVACFFTHSEEELEVAFRLKKLYRCKECGILWSGKEKK